MKQECDFSKGAREKFYNPNAVLNLPIHKESSAMITKDLLKQEIDQIQDEYVEVLYNIVKAFEQSTPKTRSSQQSSADQWNTFLEKFAGSFSEAPLAREEQGDYEVREPLRGILLEDWGLEL